MNKKKDSHPETKLTQADYVNFWSLLFLDYGVHGNVVCHHAI